MLMQHKSLSLWTHRENNKIIIIDVLGRTFIYKEDVRFGLNYTRLVSMEQISFNQNEQKNEPKKSQILCNLEPIWAQSETPDYNLDPGMSNLASKFGQIDPKWDNFKISFSTFWLADFNWS